MLDLIQGHWKKKKKKIKGHFADQPLYLIIYGFLLLKELIW